MLPEIFKDVQAVFFDLDNTLIDRDAAFARTLPAWLKKHVSHLQESEYDMHLQQILKTDNSGHTDRHQFCAWLGRTYSIDHITPAEMLNDLAVSIAENVRRDSEVIGLLRAMKKNFLIGIISNGSAVSQRKKMEQAGLHTVFDTNTVYIEGETGFAKPNAPAFTRPVYDHGIPAEKFIFIGDHPVNDMYGASQNGMRTCWIRNGQQDHPQTTVDLTLNSIQELL